MAMSRKDYWKFVDLIKDYTVMQKSVNRNFEYQSLTNLFKQVLKEDNRNFDSIRFQDAVDTKIKKLLILLPISSLFIQLYLLKSLTL